MNDNQLTLETANLLLRLESPTDVQNKLAHLAPEDRAQLSADWLAMVESATGPDPWIHGFEIIRKADQAPVGNCGFKGPPSDETVVEIAYHISPEAQGNGYATEAAAALVHYAFRDCRVTKVRAHTLPEPNASTKVLTKCGFTKVGNHVDPDDGLVWRWETDDDASPSGR